MKTLNSLHLHLHFLSIQLSNTTAFAELVFYVCKCDFRWVAPWRCDVCLGGRSGRARADGVGGRGRHLAKPLAARRARWRRRGRRGACARRPKGLCEGTLRRDFSKGLFEGTFEGTFEGFQHLHLVSVRAKTLYETQCGASPARARRGLGRQQQVQASYDNGDYTGYPRCGALYRGAALGY